MEKRKKKICVVFGTRPEAIKLAPVILALRKEKWCVHRVCVTGQHREMLDQVLQTFGIVPDKDLALMRPNQTLGGLTAKAIGSLDAYFLEERPDMVLVQGDTTTVLCATLAAFYHHIPVGHVEAGLRTWNLQAPWPEEANRVLAARLATLHFAPTPTARQNLAREGVSSSAVFVTGNTVIDALFFALRKALKASPVIPGLDSGLLKSTDQFVLITGHRREIFGPGIRQVCLAIADLARRFPQVQFVYPVHLNPNIRAPVQRILRRPDSKRSNIHLIEPVPYLPFVYLMNRATLILTDSGGIQEEAPSLGKPVLVMRENTERPEAESAGTVRLVGTSRKRIVQNVSELLTDASAYKAMAKSANPYGDGKASMRIIAACKSFLLTTRS